MRVIHSMRVIPAYCVLVHHGIMGYHVYSLPMVQTRWSSLPPIGGIVSKPVSNLSVSVFRQAPASWVVTQDVSHVNIGQLPAAAAGLIIDS